MTLTLITSLSLQATQGCMINTVGDFTTIQEAINKASVGDTIYVSAGIYFEHLIINKSVSLVGEDKYTTVIDGSSGGTVVQITADNVSISGFKVQNSGWGWIKNGIYVHMADNCEIKSNYLFRNCHNIRLNYSRGSRVIGNTMDSNGYGIRLVNSEDCIAIENSVSGCIGGVHLENATRCIVEKNYFAQNSQGIRMYSPCTFNNISENVVYNNSYDGMIETMPGNMTFHSNAIFHNNFINNTFPFIHHASNILWDIGYPFGGNYWSQYNGTDLYSGEFQNDTGNDGIGDSEHPVNTYDSDRYPLIHPYGSVRNLDTNFTYLTIQTAIDALETLEGHRVFVNSGTYQEHISVNKTVSLIGENRVNTIIDGGNAGAVVIIRANNVSVRGFTVRNSGLDFLSYGMGSGIFLDHASQTKIRNCLVTQNLNGIYLFHSETNTIEHNTIYSNYEN
jgi:parallel beta-helix repeat protein